MIIVYFDMKNECHDLAFSFGQNAFGVTKSTRKFSIKVKQLNIPFYLLMITI